MPPTPTPACVVAQYYSSASFDLSLYHSRKEKFDAPFKKIFSFCFFQKWVSLKLLKAGRVHTWINFESGSWFGPSYLPGL
jgi:hypothetical protein